MKINPYLLHSKPYFIAALFARRDALKAEGRDVISLVMGDPIEPTYPGVQQATLKALEATPVSQYPKTEGSLAYRQAVADWAQRNYGVTLDPVSEIVSANGSKEAIFHLSFLFDWSQGQEIWIPSMAYPVYEGSAGVQNIPLRKLPLSEDSGFLPDLDAITPEQWQRCQLFWLNSPHNPTTAIAGRAYFEKLLGLAEHYGFVVCSDECYNELYYSAEAPVSALEFESQQLIVLRSLSKRSHMTGYRMGAIISRNRELIRLITKMRAPMGVGTPDFIQAGGIAAWNDDAHPKAFAALYKARRDRLVSALEAKGFRVFGAEAGFYLWFSHPNYSQSDPLYEAFIEAGLLLAPGHCFGEDGEGYLRMVYCITDAVTDKVVKRIGQLQLP